MLYWIVRVEWSQTDHEYMVFEGTLSEVTKHLDKWMKNKGPRYTFIGSGVKEVKKCS